MSEWWSRPMSERATRHMIELVFVAMPATLVCLLIGWAGGPLVLVLAFIAYMAGVVVGRSEHFPAPTTPDHPVSPAYGDPGGHSEGQER